MSRLLDFAAACEHSGFSERYLRRLVSERRIPVYRDRRRIFFSPADLDGYIDAMRVEAAPRAPRLRVRQGRRDGPSRMAG
jgi:excisionase family DNA binding protein